MACDSRWTERIDDLVADGATEAEWTALRDHLADCGACRAAYDRASRDTAALEAEGSATPRAVRARLEADLFAALAAEAPAPAPSPAALQPPRRRPWLVAGMVAAAAAGILVLWSLPQPTPAPAPDAWATRGGAARDALGLRLLCVEAAAGEPRVRAAASSTTRAPADCVHDDRLQITWTLQTADGAPRYLAFFAVDADGQVRWYWPRGEASPAAPGVDVPLPGTFQLDVNHRAGRHRVFGVADRQPIDRARIDGALRDGATLGALTRALSAEGRAPTVASAWMVLR